MKESIYLDQARTIVSDFVTDDNTLEEAKEHAETSLDYTIKILTKLNYKGSLKILGNLLVVKSEIINVDTPF